MSDPEHGRCHPNPKRLAMAYPHCLLRQKRCSTIGPWQWYLPVWGRNPAASMRPPRGHKPRFRQVDGFRWHIATVLFMCEPPMKNVLLLSWILYSVKAPGSREGEGSSLRPKFALRSAIREWISSFSCHRHDWDWQIIGDGRRVKDPFSGVAQAFCNSAFCNSTFCSTILKISPDSHFKVKKSKVDCQTNLLWKNYVFKAVIICLFKFKMT